MVIIMLVVVIGLAVDVQSSKLTLVVPSVDKARTPSSNVIAFPTLALALTVISTVSVVLIDVTLLATLILAVKISFDRIVILVSP